MLLKAENLIKAYKKKMVVKGISVEVSLGEIVGLLGPNGAGKTTTFYMIAGLVKPTEGEVYLGGERITQLPMYIRAQKGMGYLAQEASVFRHLTVEENIYSVLEMTKLSKAERKERTQQLLEEFNLTHVRKNLGIVLSGGERRRTEIARALATQPQFLLLDEPFAGVDPIAVEEIQDIVTRLKYKNIGILITDHNVDETLAITDRSYLMFEGKLLKAGTAEELASDERVRKVYLGANFELKRREHLIHEQEIADDLDATSSPQTPDNSLITDTPSASEESTDNEALINNDEPIPPSTPPEGPADTPKETSTPPVVNEMTDEVATKENTPPQEEISTTMDKSPPSAAEVKDQEAVNVPDKTQEKDPQDTLIEGGS